jgi:hypothetical protein
MFACGEIVGVPTCVLMTRQKSPKDDRKQILVKSRIEEIQVESQLEEKGRVQLINDSTDVPEF